MLVVTFVPQCLVVALGRFGKFLDPKTVLSAVEAESMLHGIPRANSET